MPTVYIPQVGEDYRLTEDWSPELGWDKRNLVLFRHLKLTGQKKKYVGQYYEYDTKTGQPILDDAGHIKRTDKYVNRTVPNPLFQDDDGKFVPVTVHFPKDTILSLTQYKTSYNGYIDAVWLKVETSSDARIVGRCVEVSIEEFAGANLEEV